MGNGSYRPPAFIIGLVNRKRAQHNTMLLITAVLAAIALLIGAYALLNQPHSNSVFYSLSKNVIESGRPGREPAPPPGAGEPVGRGIARMGSSLNLLRANPIIIREGIAASIEIDTSSMRDDVFGTALEYPPEEPTGSGLSLASETYGGTGSARYDHTLPWRAMWEWTERSAQIIIPPDTNPAYMRPMASLRYPRKADGINGWVSLRFKIGKNGVYDIEILSEDPPNCDFGASVKSYIENCSVWPARVGGEVVVTEVKATFHVCLNCQGEVRSSGMLVFSEPRGF